MLDAIHRSSMRFFESTPVGLIMNRFSKDIEAVEDQISNSYLQQSRLALTLQVTKVTIVVLDTLGSNSSRLRYLPKVLCKVYEIAQVIITIWPLHSNRKKYDLYLVYMALTLIFFGSMVQQKS